MVNFGMERIGRCVSRRLKRNREYWIEKIEENMKRDKRNDALLEADGWYVIHFGRR